MTNFINKLFDKESMNFLKDSNKINLNNNTQLFHRLSIARNITSLKNQLELFVSSYPNYSNILIIGDYSQETIQSIKAALRLKEESAQDTKIRLIHIVDMSPKDRYYNGMSSLYSEVMLKKERKSYLKHLKKHNIDHSSISTKVQLVRGKEVMDDLYRFITVRNPDLVLLGKNSYSKLNKYLVKNNELHKEKSNIKHPVIVMP